MTTDNRASSPAFIVNNPSPSGVSRRTLVRGAAWSVPIIALASATPLASASVVAPCVDVPASAAWTTQSPSVGTLTGAADLNGWGGSGLPQSNVFTSWRDNGSSTAPAQVRTSTTITIGKANTTVVFVLNGLAQHGDLTERPVPVRASTVQHADITIDGVLVQRFSTYSDQTPTSTQLPIRTSLTSYPWGTYTFTYVFPTAGTYTLAYDFFLPPKADPTAGQDDIFLTSPTVVSCTAP